MERAILKDSTKHVHSNATSQFLHIHYDLVAVVPAEHSAIPNSYTALSPQMSMDLGGYNNWKVKSF